MATIGPTLPPGFSSKRKRSESPNQDHAASPPAKRSRSNSPSSSQPASRIIGPVIPPAAQTDHPSTGQPSLDNHDSDAASSDSDFGPALPSAEDSSAPTHARASPPPASESKSKAEESRPQREEWMLAPPSSADWSSRVDPTKLKNRRFNTGKSAGGGSKGSGEIDALWTETPEQRRKRLEDEVLGRKERATADKDQATEDHGRSRREIEQEEEERREKDRMIKEYNEQSGRGGSLYNNHQQRREAGRKRDRDASRDGKRSHKKQEEDDDPSKRAFDREKDMALGSKIGYKARSDMQKQAQDFGGRFGAGGYL